MLQFFVIYSLMIVIGSLFCIGWFIITRHEWVTEPNGERRLYGKIFKGWSAFWLKEKKEPVRVYFSGEQLKKKCDEIERVIPKFRGRITAEPLLISFAGVQDGELPKEDVYTIELATRIKMDKFNHPVEYSVYEERPQYVFPEWVRMPLAGCPPCFSSAYGSFIYWGVIYSRPHVLSWAFSPFWSAMFFWVVYCVSISCLNVVFYKKTV
jgi:hypothetical protein